jgi:hypothetical protein
MSFPTKDKSPPIISNMLLELTDMGRMKRNSPQTVDGHSAVEHRKKNRKTEQNDRMTDRNDAAE